MCRVMYVIHYSTNKSRLVVRPPQQQKQQLEQPIQIDYHSAGYYNIIAPPARSIVC
jgi:hypothetical protein